MPSLYQCDGYYEKNPEHHEGTCILVSALELTCVSENQIGPD